MLASAALSLLVFLLVRLLCQRHRAKNLPPGPRPIPILGNLLELNLENPMPDLERLAKRYGNVYSFFIGQRPAVVINGFQALKEALVNKANDFSGRPQNTLAVDAVQERVTANPQGVILANYSPGWKEHRRFGLMTLRNFGLGKELMERSILREIERISTILQESVGKSMDPHLMFHKATSNIICQVLFDQQFSYDDEFMEFFVGFFHESSKIVNGRWGFIYDAVPLARRLPLPFQKVFRLVKTAHQRHLEKLTEFKKTRVPGQPRQFIDCYLDELDKRGNDGSSFSEDQLRAFMFDLHFAGTDTTANTLLTVFLYLMTHPKVQERCQQEIDRVLAGKDQVSFEDRHQMPYVQAVVHEIQRVADTLPLSVFHCTTKDTELMGYSIPRGTVIIPNLSSALNEEGQWKSPHHFDPENFLNERGEFVKPEAFVPFSLGPRMCLGEGLARMEIFLITVALLMRFDFIWPEDAGEPDYDPVFGITQTPKPYRMNVQFRKTTERCC